MSTPPDLEPAIAAWLREHLARVTRRPPESIDPDASFTRLGLDSAEQLFLVSAAEDRWSVELATDAPADHPTPADFARFIGREIEDQQGKTPGVNTPGGKTLLP